MPGRLIRPPRHAPMTRRGNPMNRPIRPGEDFTANRSLVYVTKQGVICHLPRPGFFRPVTCREMGCGNYLTGWRTILSIEAQPGLIREIRNYRGWEYTEEVQPGGLVQFTFPPGQTCYKHLQGTGHLAAIDGKDPVYLHRRKGTKRRVEYDRFWETIKESNHQREQRAKEG